MRVFSLIKAIEAWHTYHAWRSSWRIAKRLQKRTAVSELFRDSGSLRKSSWQMRVRDYRACLGDGFSQNSEYARQIAAEFPHDHRGPDGCAVIPDSSRDRSVFNKPCAAK